MLYAIIIQLFHWLNLTFNAFFWLEEDAPHERWAAELGYLGGELIDAETRLTERTGISYHIW